MRVSTAMLILGSATQLAAQSAAHQPQGTEPRTAGEVIARYFAAVGGEDALRAIKAEHVRSEIVLPSGTTSLLESFKLHPNKSLTRLTMPMTGTSETGFDGTVGWSVSDLTGPVLVSGAQLEQFRRSGDLLAPLNRKTRPMTLVGRRQIDGRTALELRVQEDGKEVAEFYDLESGLLVAIATAITDSGVDTVGLMRFGEYKKFGRVLMPTTLSVRLPTGQSLVTRTTLVSHAPIDTIVFLPPPAIRALVAKRSP